MPIFLSIAVIYDILDDFHTLRKVISIIRFQAIILPLMNLDNWKMSLIRICFKVSSHPISKIICISLLYFGYEIVLIYFISLNSSLRLCLFYYFINSLLYFGNSSLRCGLCVILSLLWCLLLCFMTRWAVKESILWRYLTWFKISKI